MSDTVQDWENMTLAEKAALIAAEAEMELPGRMAAWEAYCAELDWRAHREQFASQVVPVPPGLEHAARHPIYDRSWARSVPLDTWRTYMSDYSRSSVFALNMTELLSMLPGGHPVRVKWLDAPQPERIGEIESMSYVQAAALGLTAEQLHAAGWRDVPHLAGLERVKPTVGETPS